MTNTQPRYIYWFSELTLDDVPLVGGKMHHSVRCTVNSRQRGCVYRMGLPQPPMAEYLVDIGIDSMSLNPDTVLKTTLHVLEVEQRLGRQPREEEGDE